MHLKRYHYILIIGTLLIVLAIINQWAVQHRESVQQVQKQHVQPAAAKPAAPIEVVKPPAQEIFEVQTNQKKIALTFDDGPDAKYTPQILDILKEAGAKATFFLVGSQIDKDPDVVKRIQQEGHEIGNHSMTHPDLNKLTGDALDREIVDTSAKIKNITGQLPKLFRSPYGNVSDEVKQLIAQHDMLLINWSVDTKDWKKATPESILQSVKKGTRSGSIILQHSFGSKKVRHTVQVLPEELKWLKEQGYTMVTVSELLEENH